MFKKPFSVLAAFALGLVISVSIMACADDLQEIVNCNCNDTIKELLTRIETLEKRVETIKEPNYDSLVKLVVEHLNTTTPTPTPTECPNEERLAAIEQAVENAQKQTERPGMIVAKTIKGKGISYMENQASWHGSAPKPEQVALALEELK